MTFVNPSAWQLFLVFVAVCFGHPRQALRPTPCDATQLHFPRATQMSWSSSTQSTFGNGLTLTVPPTVLPTANIECSMLSSLLNSCSSLSPGFYTMDPTKQAPCLCYSSNFWNPTSFDSAVLNCGVFVSTASPSIYLQISSLEDFCVSVGNILSASSNTASITTFSKNLTTLASTASLPTVTEVQPGGSESSNSIQSESWFIPSRNGPILTTLDFTPREIGGISAGCGVAALLAGYW